MGLSAVADKIARIALDSIRIRTRLTEDSELPIGASKFGGLPDLPPDVAWPEYVNEYGETEGMIESPGFLAQFNMQEMARHDPEGILPKTGMLYVFCATWICALMGDGDEEPAHWRILHSNADVSTLQRTQPPNPVPEHLRDDICGAYAYPFAAYQLWFHRELTLPELDTGYTSNLALTVEEEDAYYELLGLLGGFLSLGGFSFQNEPIHRLLGHAQHVQGGFPSEGGSLRLLLQLDSERDLPNIHNIYWQAGGRGYFWITPTALEQGDFSKIGMDMECT